METLETPETTIIVEAPDPLDSGEIRKLVSEFRKEGKNTVTATGVVCLEGQEQMIIGTKLEIDPDIDIEEVKRKIEDLGLTILDNPKEF